MFATTDPAKELDVYFRINKDGSFTLNFFDSGGNQFALSTYTFTVNFKLRKNETTNVLQLTEGAGITKTSYSLVIALTKTQSNLFREQNYFWELVRVKSSLEKDWLTGDAIFHLGKFDGVEQTENITISDSSEITVNITDSSNNELATGTYSTTLTFDQDQDIYHDATGTSLTFTLGTTNINGKGIILRLNKPTAVTFPGTFEADANSSALDATKLNVYFLVFFTNWNGSGLDHVIYKNSLFTAQ